MPLPACARRSAPGPLLLARPRFQPPSQLLQQAGSRRRGRGDGGGRGRSSDTRRAQVSSLTSQAEAEEGGDDDDYHLEGGDGYEADPASVNGSTYAVQWQAVAAYCTADASLHTHTPPSSSSGAAAPMWTSPRSASAGAAPMMTMLPPCLRSSGGGRRGGRVVGVDGERPGGAAAAGQLVHDLAGSMAAVQQLLRAGAEPRFRLHTRYRAGGGGVEVEGRG